MARIVVAFSVDLSVQDFFRKPTMGAVVQLIQSGSSKTTGLQKGPDFKPCRGINIVSSCPICTAGQRSDVESRKSP